MCHPTWVDKTDNNWNAVSPREFELQLDLSVEEDEQGKKNKEDEQGKVDKEDEEDEQSKEKNEAGKEEEEDDIVRSLSSTVTHPNHPFNSHLKDRNQERQQKQQEKLSNDPKDQTTGGRMISWSILLHRQAT